MLENISNELETINFEDKIQESIKIILYLVQEVIKN